MVGHLTLPGVYDVIWREVARVEGGDYSRY
jgi:hypothetical protein